MSVSVETIKTQAASTGQLLKLSWSSPALGGLKTELNLFLPYPSSSLSPASAPSSSPSGIPVLLYLAGLECTADTGPQKAGVLNAAGKAGIALVFPDTSPRGAGMPGEEDDWDFGTSAGFYLNATAGKWAQHYRMYDFVVDEVPEVLGKQGYGLDFSRCSIFGHSMGGHGALTLYLKNPGKYRSCSAFAPACNPSKTPWGVKAFSNYLGPKGGSSAQSPPAEWLEYDASHLLAGKTGSSETLHILVDTGSKDAFLENGQLEPRVLEEAAKKAGKGEEEVKVRMQEGFDHSYFFISTFSEEHVQFHAKYLK